MAVTLRSVKGSALTHAEMDANFQEIDNAVSIASENMKELTHNFTSDANYVLSTAENLYQRVKVTDTGVVLTTTRNIVVSTLERFFVAENATAQSITFITAAGTGITVLTGETLILYCDGTDVIKSDLHFKDYVDTAVTGLIGDSAKSLTTNGYQTLSNGLIFQWGTVASGWSTATTFNFNITFPNACFGCYPVVDTTANQGLTGIKNITTSTFQLDSISVSAIDNPIKWFAIGY